MVPNNTVMCYGPNRIAIKNINDLLNENINWKHIPYENYVSCENTFVTENKLYSINLKRKLVHSINFIDMWHYSQHKYYCQKFKDTIKTLLILSLKNNKYIPKYPQALFWMLPIEIMFIIFSYLEEY